MPGCHANHPHTAHPTPEPQCCPGVAQRENSSSVQQDGLWVRRVNEFSCIHTRWDPTHVLHNPGHSQTRISKSLRPAWWSSDARGWGPGSHCSTRELTSTGVQLLSAVLMMGTGLRDPGGCWAGRGHMGRRACRGRGGHRGAHRGLAFMAPNGLLAPRGASSSSRVQGGLQAKLLLASS